MGIDYYKILCLTRGADSKAINDAYRKMAIKWHPDKNPESVEMATKMFEQVAEAYEVLSNKSHRAKYDKQGEDGLKAQNKKGEGYKFSGNTTGIFEEFFGTSNPFATTVGQVPGGFKGRSKDAKLGDPFAMPISGSGGPDKMKPIVKPLELTLEELYNGCTKRMKITKNRFNGAGEKVGSEKKFLSMVINPGWRKGTKITFEREGDEVPDTIPADRVFVIVEKAHELYRREGNDLVFTATISLLEALTNFTLDVKTLDERVLSIPCNEIVSPGHTKVVKDEGMPISKRPGQNGNLRIEFKIQFPTHLSNDQKVMLQKVLRPHAK